MDVQETFPAQLVLCSFCSSWHLLLLFPPAPFVVYSTHLPLELKQIILKNSLHMNVAFIFKKKRQYTYLQLFPLRKIQTIIMAESRLFSLCFIVRLANWCSTTCSHLTLLHRGPNAHVRSGPPKQHFWGFMQHSVSHCKGLVLE